MGVKKYLQTTDEMIKETSETAESHTKVVQMHHLAARMAVNLSTAVKKANKQRLFGQMFQYQDIFMGKIEEFVTIEEFISGEFIIYMNNTGEVCGDKNDEFCEKDECLSHFSFEKSDKKLMIVDIQGSGANLYNPEIATMELLADGKILFCTGNLSKTAIDTFSLQHVCNKYCKILELEPLLVSDPSVAQSAGTDSW